ATASPGSAASKSSQPNSSRAVDSLARSVSTRSRRRLSRSMARSSFSMSSPRQAEEVLGHDVALDLRRPAVDGGGPGVEVVAPPRPGGRVIAGQEPPGDDLQRAVEQSLLGGGHQDLVDGGVGAGDLAGVEAAEGPARGQPQGVEV